MLRDVAPLAKYKVVAGCEKLLQKVENRRSCEFMGRSAAQREQGGRQGERRAHPLPQPYAVFFCLHLFDPSPRSELLEQAKSSCNSSATKSIHVAYFTDLRQTSVLQQLTAVA